MSDYIKQVVEQEENLRLRTLNLIRWVAIFGQLFAVLIAFFYFEIYFNILLALFLILCSVLLNITVSIRYPLTKILNFNETFFYLVYDLLQLILLLYFTGGLTNPFSVLILAPLVISATYLDLRRTILITLIAILSLSILSVYYYPLESNSLGISRNDFSKFEIFLIWDALIIASIFITAYCFRVAHESRKTRKALQQTQLSLSNEEKISAIMSLTAAAVHELGTPLSTISIISKELTINKNVDQIIQNDLDVIQSQIKRCSEILERLRANKLSNNSNEFINQLDFKRLINEIIGYYQKTEIIFDVECDKYFDDKNITVARSPELVQSLTNIIDNAVKFAKKKIIINLLDSDQFIDIEVIDDGCGFPSDIFPLLGEPYLRNNNETDNTGLGLGLFISKNLLAKFSSEIIFIKDSNFGGYVKIKLHKKTIGIIE